MKKSTLRMTLVLFALMLALAASAFAFAGGSGTQSDPYQVASLDDLKAVANNPSAFYKQTSDIVINDVSSMTFENGVITACNGNTWTPFDFSGSYDGNNFYITGLYVTDTVANGGLFATLNNAVVKNLNLEFAYVVSNEYAGILAAKAEGTTYISDCMTSGSVIGMMTKEKNTAGGLVGYVGKDATIDKDVSYAAVTGATSYSSNVGGLAGMNYGTITNSGFAGAVYGTATYYDAAIGGIAGYNAGNIDNSRVAGTVGGESTAKVNDCYVGGVAGVNKGYIESCQNDSAVSVENFSSGDSVCAAGGIAGMTVDADITSNTNKGAITGAYAYAGGIVGIAVSDSGAHYVDYNDNLGAVKSSYGVAGGIVGRAVAAGEGYVSIKLYVDECYNEGAISGNKSGEVAGETGTVESAQVIVSDEGTKNSNACAAYALFRINAEAVQYSKTVVAKTELISGTGRTQANPIEISTNIEDKKIIRFAKTDKRFVPAPVYVTLVKVNDATKLEAISVDASGLNYADGRITGNVVVKVYVPEGTVEGYEVVVGTSVGNKFAGATFATASITGKLVSTTVPVDVEATAGTINVTALVVDSTETMKPLCESVETSK